MDNIKKAINYIPLKEIENDDCGIINTIQDNKLHLFQMIDKEEKKILFFRHALEPWDESNEKKAEEHNLELIKNAIKNEIPEKINMKCIRESGDTSLYEIKVSYGIFDSLWGERFFKIDPKAIR